MAVDVGCGVGGEKDHGPPSSSGFAQRPAGVRASTHAVNALSLRSAVLSSVAKVAGGKRIDGHAVAAQLRRHRAGQAMESGLGGHIGVDGGAARMAATDPVLMMRPNFRGSMRRAASLRQAKAGAEIDADNAVEIRIFPFDQGLAVLDAGIVDQDVELAMFLVNVFKGFAQTAASLTSKAMGCAPMDFAAVARAAASRH